MDFLLPLPFLPVLAKTLLAHRHSHLYRAEGAMVERPSILVVDDELGPRESLRMILKPSYHVHAVEDGMTALRFLEKNSVDLITLDLKMPGLSGMDVLERIRESDPDVMVIIVTGYGTFRSVVEAIRFNVFDYISKPFSVPEIISVVKRCLDMGNTKRALNSLFIQIATAQGVETHSSQNKQLAAKIGELLCGSGKPRNGGKGLDYLETIRLISECIEKRDVSTTGHSERVSHYADRLAHHIDLSDGVRNELCLAAYLHDIGKVCISSRFMNTEGKLSSTDWAILKRHPIKSVELVMPLNLPHTVISAIRSHHERFDGTGYPDGLVGHDIPLGAQILSIANVFDSLTSKRPYRDAMGIDEAEAEIEKCAGSYFDPHLVGRFKDLLKVQKELIPIKEISCAPGGNVP